MMRRKIACGVLFLAALLSASGCGYRLSGGQWDAGAGRTLAVPMFGNDTTSFRVEQQFTSAVRRELVQRTRFHVTPEASGDVVVSGRVVSISAIPIIFTDAGRGAAYSVTVNVAVRVVDAADGAVLLAADGWTFREVFELSNNSAEFVPEDTAALGRLARQFAESLVAALHHS